VRALKAEPYTQKEAEAAAGLITDNGRKPDTMVVDDAVMADVSMKTAPKQPMKEADDSEEYNAFFSVA